MWPAKPKVFALWSFKRRGVDPTCRDGRVRKGPLEERMALLGSRLYPEGNGEPKAGGRRNVAPAAAVSSTAPSCVHHGGTRPRPANICECFQEP